MNKLFPVIGLILLGLCNCGTSVREPSGNPPSHEIWDRLLSENVRKDGMVDYQGFIRQMDDLEAYLLLLSEHAPDPDRWTGAERLAYWINAYNAFTVKLIADNYPLKSIQDLHPTPYIPGVNTIWHRKFFKIGGVETSLDEIEHSILRKKFNEPRIHFAINCASMSCPPLRNEAYTADKLENQLQEMTVRFINDPIRNQISGDHAELSSIFDWFSGDFTREGSLVDYINRYSKIQVGQDTEITFLDYDWSLNDAP